MKQFIYFVALILFLGSTSLSLAQNATPGTEHSISQPVMKWDNPRFTEIHNRMKNQRARIAEGLKTGKLTQAQSKVFNNMLEAVRGQMRNDFKENNQSGQKGLTDGQFHQLNQMLDDSSLAIFGDKHGDSSPAVSNP